MPSATIAVGDARAEGAKRIGDRSAGEPAQCWRS